MPTHNAQPPAAAKAVRGHAAVEIALLSPWILLLFLAIFNFGFFSYAAITTQNAARVAALATSAGSTSAGSQPIGCTHALQEMRMLPNIASLGASYACGALPLIVTVTPTTVSGEAASRVSVTYQSVQLFPLPFLMGRMTLTRSVEMRVVEE
jgi:hypothetical protein